MIKLLKEKLASCVNNDDILWKSNNIELYNKYSQNISPSKKQDIQFEKEVIQIKKEDIQFEKQDIKKKTTLKVLENKKIIFKPIDIILSETGTFDNCTSTVKETLIDFISKKEFSTVFGMKKSAEIMSGIVNNRWNVSTALFISFLFNKQVNYNNSNIIYNKENIKGTINTSC